MNEEYNRFAVKLFLGTVITVSVSCLVFIFTFFRMDVR